MMTPEEARDMLHYESEDGFTAPELCLTAELAARAPGMAEQIGNMHYEYAAQISPNGEIWLGADIEGRATLQFGKQCWYTNIYGARSALEDVPGDLHTRIVRRLVSPVEVVE